MGFFGIPAQAARQTQRGVSDDFLRRNECAACPLNNQAGLAHPHMPPTGANKPLVYFLGEAPGADEDRKGQQFVGQAGRILRRHLPAKWLSEIRWNNVVRTRPPNNRTPTYIEITCCRPSIERDIEASNPQAIVGFGNVPLEWAVGEAGITKWCGRRVPVLIAGQVYWYFPIVHPSAIQRDPKWSGLQAPGKYGSELEFQFAVHLRRALAQIKAGLPEPCVHTSADATAGVEWVTGAGGVADVRRVRDFLEQAVLCDIVGFDYETSCLRPYSAGARILTAAVAVRDQTFAFALDHRGAAWAPKHREAVDAALRAFLYAPHCRKVAHNLAFEMEWSAVFYGKDCLRAGKWGDSMAQAYVLDERPGAHSLEFLCQQYFGINIKKLAGVNRADLDAEPIDKVLRYNGVDAKYHRLLYTSQVRDLRAEGLAGRYARHLQRVPTAVLTQVKGVPVSQPSVLALAKKYGPRMAELEGELVGSVEGRKFTRSKQKPFRPSANEDIKFMVNRVLGFDITTADEAALSPIAHPFVKKLLEWRKAAKIYGTYITPAAGDATRAKMERLFRQRLEAAGGTYEDRPEQPSPVFGDGMFHPQTKVSWVRTSRTSSEDPNYQNWPKRSSSEAIEIRGVVEPHDPDEVIVSFDYGQIQARNVGMESLDPALVQSFWDEHDIHQDFMEELVRIYPRWVKEGARVLARDPKLQKVYRNNAKHGFVFASFFGATARKTSSALGVPLAAAERLGDVFWERFGGIKNWHKKVEADYYRTGYVTGHTGYRRRAPVSYNERINSPIQADEAEIVLDAMTRLSKIDHDLLQATMEIHDDLTFVWPKRRVDELGEVVVREMLTVPFKWAKVVPIVVEMSVGRNWASLKEAGVFASDKYDGIDMPRRSPI